MGSGRAHKTGILCGMAASVPAQDWVLELLLAELSAMSGRGWPAGGSFWRLEPGLVRGPGQTGVRLSPEQPGGPEESGGSGHWDLEFLLDVDRPEATSLINCAQGLADDLGLAARQAVSVWCATTANVGLELLTQRGTFADHFSPDAADGFPHWHTIVGTHMGWSEVGDSELQEWLVTAHPWTDLAAVLDEDLDRPKLNGIRLFVANTGHADIAEVRVNGRLHPAGTAALAQMPWPRRTHWANAQTFVLLVHPA